MDGAPAPLARRRLTVEPATPDALAPMGELIGGPQVMLPRRNTESRGAFF